MKLNFTIAEVCQILDAEFINPPSLQSDHLISRIIIDSRSPKMDEHTLFVLFQGNKTNGAAFIDSFQEKGGKVILTDQVITSQHVGQIKVENVLVALQRIAQVHREKFTLPIIGITGSNGKTTVKEWLYYLLKDHFRVVRSPKSFNSQIGVALSLLEITSEDEIALIEAGISRPNEMDTLEQMIQPTIGLFTGIGDAHQLGFPMDDDYRQKKEEKFKLFKGVTELLRWEEDSLLYSKKNEKETSFFYREEQGVILIQGFPEEVQFEIPFADEGSIRNAVLAFSTCRYLGLDINQLIHKLKTLPAISMRMERIEGKNQTILINDGYTLDRNSLEIGLKILLNNEEKKNRVVFIGEDDNVKHSLLHELERMIAGANVRVFYIGNPKVSAPFSFLEGQFDHTDDFLKIPVLFSDAIILFTGSRSLNLEKIVNQYTVKKHITQLTVDLSAMRKNLNFFRGRISEKTGVLAMVKAQSYGGGILEVARFLEEESVGYFGVAYADEGIALRKGGIKTPILVMNPEPAAYGDMISHQLEPSIYSLRLLNEFLHQLILNQRKNYPIHIKLDTGMNRLGFSKEEFAELLATLRAQPEVYVKTIFSHLATADDPLEMDFTNEQKTRFEDRSSYLIEQLGYSIQRHLCNSYGILHNPDAHYDMVRLGIGLFGLMDDLAVELDEVVRLSSRISQIRKVRKGDTVGYGRDFRVEENGFVGIVPVGYADGLRRGLSKGNWQVVVHGKSYPIVGNICMDMFMIYLGKDALSEGDKVTVFGDQNGVMEMAEKLGTIPYEILSAISSRVKRVYTAE